MAILFGLVNLLALSDPEQLPAPSRFGTLAITHVTVVHPESPSGRIPDQTVVMVGDRIRYVGEREGAPISPDARIIDGTGKFLIPGLWDSHIHTLRLSPQLHLPLLVAYGVTSARDMGDSCSWSSAADCARDVVGWMEARNRGEIVAPRLIETASYHLEELPGSDAALHALLDALVQRGDTVLKLQLAETVAPAEFDRVVQAATQRGLRVAGHLPYTVDLLATPAVMRSIEHDSSLLPQCHSGRADYDGRLRTKSDLLRSPDPARCDRLLASLVERDIAYVPTHVASSGQDLALARSASTVDAQQVSRHVIAPRRWLWALLRAAGREGAEEQKILAAFHRSALALTHRAQAAGVTLLAGTDALDADVIHGDSLHRELGFLVEAGLTPLEALRAATASPARHFHRADLGAVEAGKVADLVLLDADPLADIGNTRHIHAVIADGRWYGATEREAIFDFVSRQTSRWTMISRYLRGLWYDG
ncbi:amidohydrolase family protein [Tahibacter amnicola]|uniref:Amidohydrolase family protein n=1 Tax=Tahibacter amnicola TaxID=2976241 RepID=A0ABY6BQ30_9GAMM|nr:amidohydrolase family protein [Tahibacter amnicola]UXI70525.1 amidohydrolase family protein [Tahibacter amnicola]